MTFAETDAQNREYNVERASEPDPAQEEPIRFEALLSSFSDVVMSFDAFSDARTVALVAALAEAQGEFEPIIKNRTVSIKTKAGVTYTFDYADLDSIRRATQPALSKHGLAVISFPVKRDQDRYMRTLITHKTGGLMWAELPIPGVGDGDVSEAIKAFGGFMTYLRRYLLIGLLNLSADHDLDDDGVEAKRTSTAPPGDTADAMKAAKTIQELAGIMSKIPEKEKRNYLDLFNQRSAELRNPS